MTFNDTLPFSDAQFFYFAAFAIGMVGIIKMFKTELLSYRILITVLNVSYLLLLFPKPFHFLGLTIVLYLLVLALRKWYKKDNILLPMLVLALPILVMKTFNVLDVQDENKAVTNIKSIVQIAGLSYVVFRIMSLYIDQRRSKGKINLLSFFNYATFFPSLLIGPLDRFGRFEKDMELGYSQITAVRFREGWQSFIKGLLFKFILALVIKRYVLDALSQEQSFYHMSYMYCYLVYLFLDFAGYSLLAIGVGKMIGIDLPINFDRPFLATNPKEFWKKWHKSLGDWLGDYFFKPLFKHFTSKKIFTSIVRQNLALFLTFTLMGFWNGFELHFIASGMLFGLFSVVHNTYEYKCKKNKRDVLFGNINPKLVQFLSIFMMFNAAAFSIYIFSGNLF